MHEVGVERVLGHDQRPRHGIDRSDEARIGVAPGFVPLRDAAHVEPPLSEALLAEAADLDVDVPCQGAREIFDVHAGAAVDVRRVFLGEQRDLAERHGEASIVASRWLGAHRAS